MTDEELDAEFELDDDSVVDEEEARFRDIVREVQKVMDATHKRR